MYWKYVLIVHKIDDEDPSFLFQIVEPVKKSDHLYPDKSGFNKTKTRKEHSEKFPEMRVFNVAQNCISNPQDFVFNRLSQRLPGTLV